MALYRVNGKVVNDINVEGYSEREQWENNFDNNFSGDFITNSPIFGRMDINKLIGAGNKFTFNHYGYCQILVNLKSIILQDFAIIVRDDDGNKILSTNFADYADLAVSNSFFEVWTPIKPGYTFNTIGLSVGNDIDISYRIHNSIYEPLSLDEEFNYIERQQPIRFGQINEREININQYDTLTETWKPLTSFNDNRTDIPVSGVWTFELFSRTDQEVDIPYDGYLEINLQGALLYFITTFFTVFVEDENGNTIESWKSNFTNTGLRQAVNNITFSTGIEVKKGWKVRYNTTGSAQAGTSLYGFLYPNFINTGLYKFLTKDDITTKTLKFNDRVANDISIEEYDEDNEKWIPYKGLGQDGEARTHTTPYVNYDQAFDLLNDGIQGTFEEDGITVIKATYNGGVELTGFVYIRIFDEFGDIVEDDSFQYKALEILPDVVEFGGYLISEVKKGWTYQVNAGGFSTGTLRSFRKLDPTYRIVDTDGEFTNEWYEKK